MMRETARKKYECPDCGRVVQRRATRAEEQSASTACNDLSIACPDCGTVFDATRRRRVA